MWRNLFLLMLVGALSGCPQSGGDDATTDSAADAAGTPSEEDLQTRRYRVKACVVEYEMSGAQTGTETLYFDRWGSREATWTETTIAVAGTSRTNRGMSLTEGFVKYTVNLNKGTGLKLVNTIVQNMLKNSGAKNLGEMGEVMLKRMGGKKTGTGEIAGRTCDVWEAAGVKSWIWKGITLKTEGGMAGIKIIKTATRVTEGAPPADKLKVPEGIEIKTMGGFGR